MDTRTHDREKQSIAVSAVLTLVGLGIQFAPMKPSWWVSGALIAGAVVTAGWGFWPHLRSFAARIAGPLAARAAGLRFRWPVTSAVERPQYSPRYRLPNRKRPQRRTWSAGKKERDAVHDIRVLWTHDAATAARKLHTMLHGLLFVHEDGPIYWIPLLRPIERDLFGEWQALDQLLAAPEVRLHDVRVKFNAFFKAYGNAVIWFSEVMTREKTDPATIGAPGDLDRWRKENKRFRENYKKLLLRPEHAGTLIERIDTKRLTAFVNFQYPDEADDDSKTHRPLPY